MSRTQILKLATRAAAAAHKAAFREIYDLYVEIAATTRDGGSRLFAAYKIILRAPNLPFQ